MTEYCFYCDAALAKDMIQKDHFPIPDRLGGKNIVHSCVTCHDMKDRFNTSHWSVEWVGRIIKDFPSLGRESRIFLAKTIDAMMDIENRQNNAKQ